jgi:hypothetical protein
MNNKHIWIVHCFLSTGIGRMANLGCGFTRKDALADAYGSETATVCKGHYLTKWSIDDAVSTFGEDFLEMLK